MSKWILCVGMIAWGAGLRAQVLHPAGGGVRSVITYSDCGPGVSVDFSSAYVAPLTYQFTPESEVSGLITWTTSWMMAHIDGWSTEQLGPELTQTFPQAGDHLVCLALRGITMDWFDCAAITCHVVDALPDPACADLVPDFTIAAVAGETITFIDQTTFPGGEWTMQWDFADEMSIASQPQFTFAGPGPHEVCLTVISASPAECSRTVCKWLYLGPVPVPCDTLFAPGFVAVTFADHLLVVDTSSTAGMDRTVWWDMGDGSAPVSGPAAIHRYAEPGVYPVCSTVEFSGALTDGVCAPTHCTEVMVMGITTGVDQWPAAQEPTAMPNPFTTTVALNGLAEGPLPWSIHSITGQVVASGTLMGGDHRVLDPGPLAPGVYVLRGVQQARPFTIRLLKE
jgi:hypothetical protein